MTAADESLKAPTRQATFARPSARAVVAMAVLTLTVVSYHFLDRPVLRLALALPHEVRDVAAGIAGFGDAGFWAPALFVGWALLSGAAYIGRSERLVAYAWAVLFTGMALAASAALVDILKIAFGRFDPSFLADEGSYGFAWIQAKPGMLSFPSGHASTSAAIATALSLMWPRARAVLIAVGGTAVAARAAQPAHFLSDVIAGAGLGVMVTVWVYRQFERTGIDLTAAPGGRMAIRDGEEHARG